MKISKPQIRVVNGEHICWFPVEKAEAIEIAEKSKNFTFSLESRDIREKTYPQIKFFWGLLNEFLTEFTGEEQDKETLEEMKEALYIDYGEIAKVNFRLSEATVTDARLFLNYVIKEFGTKYNFVSKNIVLQNEFNAAYIYSTLINQKCAVCGEKGKYRTYNKNYICLCEKHRELTVKELNEHYLSPIKISDELKGVIYEF